jgi:hypothetical protein
MGVQNLTPLAEIALAELEIALAELDTHQIPLVAQTAGVGHPQTAGVGHPPPLSG